MIDFSSSGLQQLVTVELLNRKRQSINALDGVRSISVERNQYATPSTGGQLEIFLEQDLDLNATSFRIWVTVKQNGEQENYPLLTGIPVVTGRNRTARAHEELTLKLLDYTRLLDVPLGKAYSLAPGDFVTAKVRELLLSVGATDASVTESNTTVSNGMYWPATETKRRVVNDLLASIGYRAIWADAWGKLRAEPYVSPADRPVLPERGFEHGVTCTYRPAFTIDHDTSDVPNHAVITPRMAGELEPVVGEAWLPPEHPLSYETRQLEVPYTEAEVDLSVQALEEDPTPAQISAYVARMQEAATAYAARKLQQLTGPTRSYQVSNRWRPFELQDVTRFTAPAVDYSPAIDTRVSIIKDSVRYEAGGTLSVTTTLQEVN